MATEMQLDAIYHRPDSPLVIHVRKGQAF